MYYYNVQETISGATDRIKRMQLLAGEVLAAPQDEFTRKDLSTYARGNDFLNNNIDPDRTEDFIVKRSDGTKIVATRYWYAKSTILDLIQAETSRSKEILKDCCAQRKDWLTRRINELNQELANRTNELIELETLVHED